MSVYSTNKYNKKTPNDAWFKIFELIKPGSKILDIGCSSGNLGEALKKEKRVSVIGIDIDKQDVTAAKKVLDGALLLNVEEDDLTQLGTFDIIIMADVIEHLIDPVSALKKIKANLNPKGQLIFSIPNMANATVRLELLKGRFEYRDWGLLDRTHLHYYDHMEVERVFMAAGYDVLKTDCTVREIPDTILKKELATIGLELTKEFSEHLRNTDALVYQFIGAAVTSAKPSGFTPKTSSSLDSVSRQLDAQQAKHQKEMSSQISAFSELQKQTIKLEEEVRRLNHELTGILTSRSWKLVQQAQSVKRRLSPRHGK